MTFWAWMKMNMFFDICFIVFSVFFVWKNYKLNLELKKIRNDHSDVLQVLKNFNKRLIIASKKLSHTSESHDKNMKNIIDEIVKQSKELKQLDDKIYLVTKNPQAAKRNLMKNK